jgi:flagellar hook-associated protein 1
MSNLLAMYNAAGSGLDAFQKALAVIQNNVSNSNTPGFAKQRINLQALPLDITGGSAGGVLAAGLQDSRDQFAEEAVQRQTQSLGLYSAQAQTSGTIQSLFDISGTGGVPAALTGLFQSFSAWSTTPNDVTARQNVISGASSAASAIRQLANSLTQAAQQIDNRIGSSPAQAGANVTPVQQNGVLGQINNIAAQIQQYNTQKLKGGPADPAQDAQLYSNLQSLSQLVDFSAVTQSNGTVTVMLSGGTPLVIGEQSNPLSLSLTVDNNPPALNPQSLPTDHIVDSNGNDVTSQITGGQLGGLLDMRNRVLASYLGDAQQQGSLNELAQGLTVTVNTLLKAGKVSSDPNAASGSDLFTYGGADPTQMAANLQVTGITSDQLAPFQPANAATGAAAVSNGVANSLAALTNSASIQGMNFVQFYGQMAAAVGQENSNATSNQQTQQQVVAQATSLRDQVSGVSLDEQAAQILQFQRAYQANAQVLTVIDSLAQTTLSLIPPS